MHSSTNFNMQTQLPTRRQLIELWLFEQWFVKLTKPFLWMTWPLSQCYQLLQYIHRVYQTIRCDALPDQPKICAIGNLIIGGAGKSPVTIHLCQTLEKNGLKVAVVCRNLSKKSSRDVVQVTETTHAMLVGDEAKMIQSKTNALVVVSQKKYLAYRWIIKHQKVDVILIDDGLQHYRIPRHYEILVTDDRLYGNRYCLPSGPLREPIERASQTNCQLSRGDNLSIIDDFDQLYRHTDASLVTPDVKQANEWCIVTAIAHPKRLKLSVSNWLKRSVVMYSYPDHDDFSSINWEQFSGTQIIMTEKDAVKCPKEHENIWVLPQIVKIQESVLSGILSNLHVV